MNAVAAGGSFVSFPMMVLVGLPLIAANATNTVALFPGTVASTWAYFDKLSGVDGISLRVRLPFGRLLRRGDRSDDDGVWTLIDSSELKAMAPARTTLVSAANRAAVLCFAVAGTAWWPEMLATMVSAIAGGYFGARFARHLPPAVLRWFVVALSATFTVVFLLRRN
jgi:uncharacterized membrane protein YfcA